MTEKTNLVFANRSGSLRTTVPSHIVKQFKLKNGDKLEWELIVEQNALKIVLKPVKKDDN